MIDGSRGLRVCVVGATGWTGRALIAAIVKQPDLSLVGAVARRTAGRDVGEVLGLGVLNVTICSTAAEALSTPADVMVDYSSPRIVFSNVLSALERGVRVVIGTSGLTTQEYAEVARLAAKQNVGVIAAGNFSITAALLKHFAAIAAGYLGDREIIDYADGRKEDVPSGTALELADSLDNIGPAATSRAIGELYGPVEARGLTVNRVQVHSVRLPGFALGVEVLFGAVGERLSIRHDAGTSAEPYVRGTLLAVRRVGTVRGLVRGFDQLLLAPSAHESERQTPLEGA